MKRAWHSLRGVVSSSTEATPEPIYVAVVKSSTPVPEIAQCVEADQTFQMQLPEGTFTLRAYAQDGRLSGESTVDVPLPISARVEIRLEPVK